jgi:catalase
LSQTPPEQNHIVSALVFELSKVETAAIRERVCAHLAHVDESLAKRVAAGLGLDEAIKPAETRVPAKKDVEPSPALSILAKAPQTLKGRVVGCLAADGADRALVDGLRKAVETEGAQMKIVAPRIGGVKAGDGSTIAADMRIDGGPSVLFDAVALIVDEAGARALAKDAAAVAFVADAFNHLKAIGYTVAAEPLLRRAGIGAELADEGVSIIADANALAGFVATARKMRIWEREAKVRNLP